MKKVFIIFLLVLMTVSIFAATAKIIFSFNQCCCWEYYYVNNVSNSNSSVEVAPYAINMNLLLND